MRGVRLGGVAFIAALGLLNGCAGDGRIKPPRPEHQYVLPPGNDPRFSTYPKFPDKTLNQFEKKSDDDPNGQGMPSRGGMGRPGMGGGGMGGGGMGGSY